MSTVSALIRLLDCSNDAHVNTQALDNKAPTCCTLLCLAPRSNAVAGMPLLAVGCNDGVVRLVHLGSLQASGVLYVAAL